MSNELAVARNNLSKSLLIKALIASTAMAASYGAIAASFQLHEQSTTYLGTAMAGTASTAEDASTEYYNPAGLTEIKNYQAVASAIYYNASIKLENASAANNYGTVVGTNATTKPKSSALIPGLHLAIPLTKDFVFGFGVVAPFGLSTKYDAESVARYKATTSKIDTIDITPSLAFRINDQFSVGAGFDAMFVRATVQQDINFSPLLGNGYVNNYGNRWAYGYHVGVLFKPTCDLSMGLTYFSEFNVYLRGHVDTAAYPAFTVSAPTTFNATLNLPDRLVYSITYHFDSKWTGMADVEWDHWSRLQELKLNYNNGTNSTIAIDNKNTWRGSLGLNYKWSDPLKFKAGFCFDESPVRSPQYRIANLPDGDRYWIAIGAKLKANKYISLDVAYSHLFFQNVSIAEVSSVSTDKSYLYGNYKGSANLIGAQITLNLYK
jgi:long-chain fatty acid transport protein